MFGRVSRTVDRLGAGVIEPELSLSLKVSIFVPDLDIIRLGKEKDTTVG